MALQKKQIETIIKDNQRAPKDTGSSEVQIALLTQSINELSAHLIKHKKDKHSRLGLYKKVSKRAKLLKYVRKNSEEEYLKIIKKLGIRDKKSK
jgi:small subunit ribosomal protein S15